MNQFSVVTLAFFRALGVARESLEQWMRWAQEQAPELGTPAELFRRKVIENVPGDPARLILFIGDAFKEWTGEDPGYSSSGGLGAG